jgi:hypothetical protein
VTAVVAHGYDSLVSLLTRDPLDGVPGTTVQSNPYHYADNDPLNKTDPTGMRSRDGAFTPNRIWLWNINLPFLWGAETVNINGVHLHGNGTLGSDCIEEPLRCRMGEFIAQSIAIAEFAERRGNSSVFWEVKTGHNATIIDLDSHDYSIAYRERADIIVAKSGMSETYEVKRFARAHVPDKVSVDGRPLNAWAQAEAYADDFNKRRVEQRVDHGGGLTGTELSDWVVYYDVGRERYVVFGLPGGVVVFERLDELDEDERQLLLGRTDRWMYIDNRNFFEFLDGTADPLSSEEEAGEVSCGC